VEGRRSGECGPECGARRGGILLVLLVWFGLALVSLLFSACMLDVGCY